MTRIEEIEATIVALQEELRQLRAEERTAKINEITELLASASNQKVDYVLNYLKGSETAQNVASVVIPTGVAAPTDTVPTVTEPVATGDVIVEPIIQEPVQPRNIIVEPIMEEPSVPTAEPTTQVFTEPANVEDYLVDGHIPWTDATISVVGLSHQEMWSMNHDSPQVGDRVKLYPPQRQDGRVVRSILAHTMEDEPRAIGILPQSDSKIQELEAIGAPIVKNRDAYADEAMRNGKIGTVVGIIPGRYCFIKLDEEESAPSTPEPAPVEEPEVPEGVERILEGFAADAAEARRMFEAQKASHHLFSKVEEIGRFFKVEYFDNRCNSNDFIKSVAVAKAE